MAQLAVEYLLDPDGLGRSPKDLAAVMVDMGNNVSFAEAFENHIGFSQSDYETQFFALMDTYLPQSESPLEAVALGLVCLLAAGAIGGSLVWGFQHWPAVATTTGVVGEPASGRRGRRGFLVEISVVTVISVGFVALLLYRIAFADLPPYVQRAPAYLITAAYYVASAGILMWAIRRWSDRAPGAYLTPLLVIVVTGLTIVAMELMF